jgi:hypothetical protein
MNKNMYYNVNDEYYEKRLDQISSKEGLDK